MKKAKVQILRQWSLRSLAIVALSKQIAKLTRKRGSKRKEPEPQETVSVEADSEDRFLRPTRIYEEPEEFSDIASKSLLCMFAERENVPVTRIPDKDRVILNEAISALLPLNCIPAVLERHPRALEAHGIVDHIDHPIHNACRKYRAVVPLLLKANPLVVTQMDTHGVYPIEIFCSNYNRIDISVEAFVETIELFLHLDPSLAKRSFWMRPDVENEMRQILSERHILSCVDEEVEKEVSVPYGFGLLYWN